MVQRHGQQRGRRLEKKQRVRMEKIGRRRRWKEGSNATFDLALEQGCALSSASKAIRCWVTLLARQAGNSAGSPWLHIISIVRSGCIFVRPRTLSSRATRLSFHCLSSAPSRLVVFHYRKGSAVLASTYLEAIARSRPWKTHNHRFVIHDDTVPRLVAQQCEPLEDASMFEGGEPWFASIAC